MIEVDDEQSADLALSQPPAAYGEIFEEVPAVREAGQQIVARGAIGFALSLLPLADLAA
jgi:hypothetical protein